MKILAAIMVVACVFACSSRLAPLTAAEVLMSRSGFDFWLRRKTQPQEQRLDAAQSRLAILEIMLGEWEYANCDRMILWPDNPRVETYAPNGIHSGSSTLDTPPSIIGGRTMVPLRFIGEALGAEVLWDDASRKITYISDTRLIELSVGQTSVLVNGISANMDTAPLIINNRTMVPVRFVSQWLGAVVRWYDTEKKVEIIYVKK